MDKIALLQGKAGQFSNNKKYVYRFDAYVKL
jgi:hypothetical protein